jgi:hypothetical protein
MPESKKINVENIDEVTREKILERKKADKEKMEAERRAEMQRFLGEQKARNKSINAPIVEGDYVLMPTSIFELIPTVEKLKKKGYKYLDSINYGQQFYTFYEKDPLFVKPDKK